MFASKALRPAARLLASAPRITPVLTNLATPARSFAINSKKQEKHDLPGHNEEGQGSFSRTDKTIQVEHPDEENHPPSQPIQGRGGMHFQRTLASFTLEGRVAVVTGGARGLGLVMAQALVISGADVALVDLSSKLGKFQLSLQLLTM